MSTKAELTFLPEGADELAFGSYLGLWSGYRVVLDNGAVFKTKTGVRGINVRCRVHVPANHIGIAEVVDVPKLLAPAVWCKLKGFKIMDPDGWRGANGRMFDDPITEQEFNYRASQSTIYAKKKALIPPNTLSNQIVEELAKRRRYSPAPLVEFKTMTTDQALALVHEQVIHAELKHPNVGGCRHCHSVIREEFQEFEDAIYGDRANDAFKEAAQLAAVCIRYMKAHAPSSVRQFH